MGAVVAKKKPVSEENLRMRCPADWLERVDEHAQRRGMTRSAYIRHMVSLAMDEEDKERARKQAEEKQ